MKIVRGRRSALRLFVVLALRDEGRCAILTVLSFAAGCREGEQACFGAGVVVCNTFAWKRLRSGSKSAIFLYLY